MDATEKAFDFDSKSSKLLITISTGIIGITIAFLDKDSFLQADKMYEKIILISSWIILLGSAIVGIWTQLGLTNVLEPQKKSDPFKPSIQDERIKKPFRFQIILFAIGVIMTVVFGVVKIL